MDGRKGPGVWVMSIICLAASMMILPELWAKPSKPAEAGSKDLFEVKVHRLTVDPASMQPVVFLADIGEERALPIWIGPCEANALNSEMEGVNSPRPLTHDLAGRIIKHLKGKIQRVIITHSQGGIYYATLVIEQEGSTVEIDARPSDCIVLAMKSKAPIFVSRALFGEMSVSLKEQKGVEEQYGLSVQDLNPSLAQSFSFKSARGVLVSEVKPGSRAEKDGVVQGDILVEVGKDPVNDVPSLREALSKIKSAVKVKIFRKGDYLSVTFNPK
jgi:bifunctional DNase/RNase